ncbi:MAG: hypothetical protein ACRCX2_20890 [Paraclostridium sp.]
MGNKLKELLIKRKKELELKKESYWKFKPRIYQKKIITKYEEGIRFFLICWCRRLGKDLLAFSLAAKQCLETPNSIVYYVFPTMKQGKMMILDGYTNDKRPIITTVVSEDALIKAEKSGKLYHHDNTIKFINGSIIYFVGAQDANSKVGGNLDLLVISEAGLIKNPDILTYLIPSVINVGGRIILVSTPRFGSLFNDMLDQLDSMWFKDVLKANEAFEEDGTPVYTEKKLAEAAKLMSKSKFAQEYFCDTEVANEESIYSESLELRKTIVHPSPLPERTTVALDLGINDSTALTFYYGTTMVHHYHNIDKPTQHYIEYIQKFMAENNRNIQQIEIVLPHDSRNRHDAITHLISRQQAYLNVFGGGRVFIVPAQDVNKTIEITKWCIEQGKISFLKNQSVDECVKLMKKYEWKIDSTTGENLRTPIHGRKLSASNTCDSVEYMCVRTFKDEYDKNQLTLLGTSGEYNYLNSRNLSFNALG